LQAGTSGLNTRRLAVESRDASGEVRGLKPANPVRHRAMGTALRVRRHCSFVLAGEAGKSG